MPIFYRFRDIAIYSSKIYVFHRYYITHPSRVEVLARGVPLKYRL